MASASFWEGVDVPGDALQLLVIDKLPFPPPNDPLVEARARRLGVQGGSPFNDYFGPGEAGALEQGGAGDGYFVPEAAVALRQGAGRLIRREADQGILVVCDIRMVTMSYGRRLLAALPPMRVLEGAAEFEQALDEIRLTRVSTRDCSPA